MTKSSKNLPTRQRSLTDDDLSHINRAAIPNIRAVLDSLLPGGRIESDEYVVRNPRRADKGLGSFKIRLNGEKAGVWSDFATGERGRDPIALVAYVTNTSRQEAGRLLQQQLRDLPSAEPTDDDTGSTRKRFSFFRGSDPKSTSGEEPIEFICPPTTSVRLDSALAQLQWTKPDQKWLYRTASGAKAFYAMRWDRGNKKVIRPLSYCRTADGESWRPRAWPKNRPLYKLPDLLAEKDARVIVCEGEKAADAAAKLFPRTAVSTTSSGGAGASSKSDWSAIAGRKVLIWPDADEPGLAYAQVVGRTLDALGCEVAMVDTMALAAKAPSGGSRKPLAGWDAADAVEDWENKKALRAAVRQHELSFDLGPRYLSYGPFSMTPTGLKYTPRRPNEEAARRDVDATFISSAFEIMGESRGPQGQGWGKWVRFVDRDGRIHQLQVLDAELQGDPAVPCGKLADHGLTISPDQRRTLASYLSRAKTDRRGTVVNRTGWHVVGGRHYFVLPQETIGPAGFETIILDASAVGPYEVEGTLKGWQDGIAKPAARHHLVTLAISVGLAGVLLEPTKQEGGGLNFYGVSSTGKTTLGQLAASLWGKGSSAGGFVRGWSATANGLEAIAASANDTVLILDELGVLDARAASAAIYGLANGAGKSRMTRDTSLRETKTWRIIILSTGEIPMEAKMFEEGGRRGRAGERVRMLDIPADRGKGFGVFSSAGSSGDASHVADAFKQQAMINYGTAGPEFVRRVVALGLDKASDAARRSADYFVAHHVPKAADGQVVRAGRRLGQIAAAGELATEVGITGWKKGSATNAAAWAFKRWLATRGGVEPTEVRQAISAVRLFIEQHGDSRFDSLDGSAHDQFRKPAVNRAGWRKGSGEEQVWLIPSETWRSEVCVGLDAKFTAKTLSDAKILKRGRDGFQTVRKIEGKCMRVYEITAAIFDGAEGVEEKKPRNAVKVSARAALD